MQVFHFFRIIVKYFGALFVKKNLSQTEDDPLDEPMKRVYVSLMFLVLCGAVVNGQDNDLSKQLKELQKSMNVSQHLYDALEKRIDDVLWYHRIGDAAFIVSINN